MLLLKEVWVRSLVGELTSCMPWGVAKKEKINKKTRANIAQHPQWDRWSYAGADVISILQKKTLRHRRNRPETGSKMLSYSSWNTQPPAPGFALFLCLPFFCCALSLSTFFFSQQTYIGDTRHIWHHSDFSWLPLHPCYQCASLRESNHDWFLQWPGNSLHLFLAFGHNLTSIHCRRWASPPLGKPQRKPHRTSLWLHMKVQVHR